MSQRILYLTTDQQLIAMPKENDALLAENQRLRQTAELERAVVEAALDWFNDPTPIATVTAGKLAEACDALLAARRGRG